MHASSETDFILGMAIPLLLGFLLLVALGWLVYDFSADFEFYHPTLFGPFLQL